MLWPGSIPHPLSSIQEEKASDVKYRRQTDEVCHHLNTDAGLGTQGHTHRLKNDTREHQRTHKSWREVLHMHVYFTNALHITHNVTLYHPLTQCRHVCVHSYTHETIHTHAAHTQKDMSFTHTLSGSVFLVPLPRGHMALLHSRPLSTLIIMVSSCSWLGSVK